jgi:hypothetical protein
MAPSRSPPSLIKLLAFLYVDVNTSLKSCWSTSMRWPRWSCTHDVDEDEVDDDDEGDDEGDDDDNNNNDNNDINDNDDQRQSKRSTRVGEEPLGVVHAKFLHVDTHPTPAQVHATNSTSHPTHTMAADASHTATTTTTTATAATTTTMAAATAAVTNLDLLVAVQVVQQALRHHGCGLAINEAKQSARWVAGADVRVAVRVVHKVWFYLVWCGRGGGEREEDDEGG